VGYHSIRVDYFQSEGDSSITTKWSGPGISGVELVDGYHFSKPVESTEGKCGPLHDDLVCSGPPYVWCNEVTGMCGDTDEFSSAQESSSFNYPVDGHCGAAYNGLKCTEALPFCHEDTGTCSDIDDDSEQRSAFDFATMTQEECCASAVCSLQDVEEPGEPPTTSIENQGPQEGAETAPPAPSPPPPAEVKLCNMQADGSCKSMLNSRCASWRDHADTWSASKQLEEMQQCMSADCVQSLESGSATPGCRFLDTQGFCYAYNSAQTWCASEGAGSSYCRDGGEAWAVPPLGSAEGPQAGWTPSTFPYRGSSADRGAMECMCMKDCACTDSWCRCTNPEQTPVGPVTCHTLSPCGRARCLMGHDGLPVCSAYTYVSIHACLEADSAASFQGKWRPPKIIESSKTGMCACFCNDVTDQVRRRNLLSQSSEYRVALADVAGGAHAQRTALLSSSPARRLLAECDCSVCPKPVVMTTPSPVLEPTPAPEQVPEETGEEDREEPESEPVPTPDEVFPEPSAPDGEEPPSPAPAEPAETIPAPAEPVPTAPPVDEGAPGEVPVVENEEPTEDEEPATAGEERATASDEPATENEEPAFGDEVPVAEEPASIGTESGPAQSNAPTQGPPLVHAYDSKTGKVFSGPDTEGRYNKDKWEGATEDPFGFRKKARIWQEQQDQAKADFDGFVRQHESKEYVDAAKKALQVSQRKTDEIAFHGWKGRLPPLIYRDNHWLKKP